MTKHRVLIASFLKPKPVSFEFVDWPNHITVVGYFLTSNLDKLIDDVKATCVGLSEISYHVGVVDYFGREKNVKVSRVDTSNALLKLHTDILNIALKYDKNINTKYAYQNYLPHISHYEEPYPKEGDSGFVKTIYLIEDLLLVTKKKKVIAKIDLVFPS